MSEKSVIYWKWLLNDAMEKDGKISITLRSGKEIISVFVVDIDEKNTVKAENREINPLKSDFHIDIEEIALVEVHR